LLISLRYASERGSQSAVWAPEITRVPISRAVIPQKVTNRKGYFFGS
jgi:hypothetical protein